mgnify:CR=1 FL=1
MPKEEWGVKRLCPTTGKRFYDLNKDPIVSPYTGETIEMENGKSRMIAADAEDAATKKAKAKDAEAEDTDDVVLDDDDDVDLDLGDDVLEDDDDTVSLDEIADVASEDDDS